MYKFQYIKFFFHKNIQRTCVIMILGIFYVLMLTTCSVNRLNKNNSFCSINKNDDVKYLHVFNKDLFMLKIPKNLNVTLSHINTDYNISGLDIIKDYDNKNKINICPPEMFEDVLSKSCMISTN